MQRTNIFLTEEQQEKLRHRAAEEGVSKSSIIRQILDDALSITRTTVSVEEAVRTTSGIWADRTDEELNNVFAWRGEVPLERLAR